MGCDIVNCKKKNTFLKKNFFVGHESFCGATDTPVVDL